MTDSKVLKRLSICPCGFPVLDESIILGTVYQIEQNSLRGGFFFRCGGCGATYENVFVVNANQILHPDYPSMPLPFDLFAEIV